MAVERILKIYILECITEYIFGKTNKKGERNRGEGTKVYIAVICSFICNMYKKFNNLGVLILSFLSIENRYF